MSLFSSNKGFIDKIKNKRIGLIFIHHNDYDDNYNITSYDKGYNLIYEVKELFIDKVLSKVEVVNIPFNKCERAGKVTKNFNPWVRSTNIHWLTPPTDIDRENKINDLLEK